MYFVVSGLPEKYSPMRTLLRNEEMLIGICILVAVFFVTMIIYLKVNNTNYHRIQFTCCMPMIKN